MSNPPGSSSFLGSFGIGDGSRNTGESSKSSGFRFGENPGLNPFGTPGSLATPEGPTWGTKAKVGGIFSTPSSSDNQTATNQPMDTYTLAQAPPPPPPPPPPPAEGVNIFGGHQSAHASNPFGGGTGNAYTPGPVPLSTGLFGALAKPITPNPGSMFNTFSTNTPTLTPTTGTQLFLSQATVTPGPASATTWPPQAQAGNQTMPLFANVTPSAMSATTTTKAPFLFASLVPPAAPVSTPASSTPRVTPFFAAAATPLSTILENVASTSPAFVPQSTAPTPTIVPTALHSIPFFAPAAPTSTSLFPPTEFVTTPSIPYINATLAPSTNTTATNNAWASQIPAPTELLTQAVSASPRMNRNPYESRLKNKSLDEITDQWTGDVEKYKKEFQDSGSNIKKWDTILVEGRSKITRLVTESKEAERTQSIIDNALEQLESEQLDMEKLFDYYEAVLSEMEMESLGARPTDIEREQMFNTIIKLSSKLTEMQTGAENLIASLNILSSRVENSNTDSYFSSIVRILNQHLQIMQWINTQTAALSVKTVKAKAKSWNPDTEGDETMRNLNVRHRLRY